MRLISYLEVPLRREEMICTSWVLVLIVSESVVVAPELYWIMAWNNDCLLQLEEGGELVIE